MVHCEVQIEDNHTATIFKSFVQQSLHEHRKGNSDPLEEKSDGSQVQCKPRLHHEQCLGTVASSLKPCLRFRPRLTRLGRPENQQASNHRTRHKMKLPSPNSSSHKQIKPIRHTVLIVTDDHDGLQISHEAGWSPLTVILSNPSSSTRAKMYVCQA